MIPPHASPDAAAGVGQVTRPLADRVCDTVFEEPYTDEFGRRIFTAVTASGMRLAQKVAAPGEVEHAIEALHEDLARARQAPMALRLVTDG